MFILVIFGLFVVQAESYVLLQVRKQDNNFSNIDALIHKVVPSDKVDKIASKFGRKQVKIDKEYLKPNAVKREEEVVENRTTTEKIRERNIKDIEKSIMNLASKDKPMFRSQDSFKQDKYVKPKIINFRSGKPSFLFEIDSKAIVKTIKNLLSSDKFQSYMDIFAKQAAMAYRTIKEEIDKKENS